MTKHAADEEERRLFRTAVGQVKRLRQDTVRHDRSRPFPEPLQTHLDEQRVMRDLLSGRHDAAKLETGEELRFARTTSPRGPSLPPAAKFTLCAATPGHQANRKPGSPNALHVSNESGVRTVSALRFRHRPRCSSLMQVSKKRMMSSIS